MKECKEFSTDSNNDLPRSILKSSQTTSTKYESVELENVQLLKSVLKKESEVSQTSDSIEAFPRSIMKNDHLKSKKERKGAFRSRNSKKKDNLAKQVCSDDDNESESDETSKTNAVPCTRSRTTNKQSRFAKNLNTIDVLDGVQTISESSISRKNFAQEIRSEKRKNITDNLSAISEAK